MPGWTDHFVGDRMAVDREFSERVAASEFSSQEWGTIMTAVELEIEAPESPEDARVVADTSRIDQVMPALEEMQGAMGAGGMPGGAGRGSSGSSGGFIGSIKDSLGLGSDATDDRSEAAAALADEYARQFQEHLEAQGKWEQACLAAAREVDGDRATGEFTGEVPDVDGTDAEPDDAGSGDGESRDDSGADE